MSEQTTTDASAPSAPRAASGTGTSAAASLDPRVERSRRLICEAAIAELGEVGYGAMTVESIAKRAGVGKATIYRHWSGKLDLVASALAYTKDEIEAPTEGSARDRIRTLLGWVATYLADPERSGPMPALVSASVYDPAVRDFHHRFSAERRRLLVELLADGLSSGELATQSGVTDDLELLAELLVGPIFYSRLMTPTPFDPDRVDEILDLVFGPE